MIGLFNDLYSVLCLVDVNFDDVSDSRAALATSLLQPLKSLSACQACRMFAWQEKSIYLCIIADVALQATSICVFRLLGTFPFWNFSLDNFFLLYFTIRI